MLSHPSTRNASARSTSCLDSNHTNKGWRFATESPWTLWHTGGCPTGKAVSGPKWPPRDDHRQATTRHRQASRQTCFQQQVPRDLRRDVENVLDIFEGQCSLTFFGEWRPPSFVGGWYIARGQYSSLGEGAAVVSLGAVVMEEGVQVRVQVG